MSGEGRLDNMVAKAETDEPDCRDCEVGEPHVCPQLSPEAVTTGWHMHGDELVAFRDSVRCRPGTHDAGLTPVLVLDLAGAREQIARALGAHRVGAFNGQQTACTCDRTWRWNAEHETHLRDHLLAALVSQERGE